MSRKKWKNMIYSKNQTFNRLDSQTYDLLWTYACLMLYNRENLLKATKSVINSKFQLH